METVGSLIDKLSINELKIYHMQEHESQMDISPELKEKCKNKIALLKEQRDDLTVELQQLINDIKMGKSQFKVFRQMKMYNDKNYED